MSATTQLTIQEPKASSLANKNYAELKAIIIRDRSTVQQWFNALIEIRARELWRGEANTWQDWCLKYAGMTADAIRVKEYRQRLGKEPKVFQRAKALLEEVSARKDDEAGEPVMVEPPPIDELPPIPVDVRVLIHRAVQELDSLLQESPLALSEKFRHALNCVKKADALLQPVLPGLENFQPRSKTRGTMEEIKEFCEVVGLTLQDAQWFFAKCQGTGWKVNGKTIADWRGVVRQWKIQGDIFPSHKAAGKPAGTNGHLSPAEMMVRQKELEDCNKQMKSLRDSYTDNMTWSVRDSTRFRQLKDRKDELKAILGIKV